MPRCGRSASTTCSRSPGAPAWAICRGSASSASRSSPACRPQTQERLTKQIADWLQENLAPRAVGVVVVAEHTCMTLRGAQAIGSSTVTSTLLGQLRDDPRSRQEFLTLAGV